MPHVPFNIALILFLLGLLSTSASAQIGFNWGPEAAPAGSPVNLLIQNHTPQQLQWDPGGFEIFDAAGNQVSAAPTGGPVTLPPQTSFAMSWDQTDAQGAQVPPGRYFLGTPQPGARFVDVGGAAAAITPTSSRSFTLSAPQESGRIYLMMLSSSRASGIPTCAGTLPLDPGPLFDISLRTPALFQGFVGVLDSNGQANANIDLPVPYLAATQLSLAFVVLEPGAPCLIREISAPLDFLLF